MGALRRAQFGRLSQKETKHRIKRMCYPRCTSAWERPLRGVRSWWAEAVQRQWGRQRAGEELGRVSTLEGSGIRVKRGREKGRPLPGHLCSEPVPMDSVHRLPATLAIPTLAGWGLAWGMYYRLALLPKCSMERGDKGKLHRKMSLLSQLHRPLTLHYL